MQLIADRHTMATRHERNIMLSSDPHRGESIDIESFIDNGWYAIGVNLNDGTLNELSIGDDGEPQTYCPCRPLSIVYAQLIVHGVLIREIFYTVYLLPPCDGME